MAKKQSLVHLFGVAPDGRELSLYFPRQSPTLCCIAGPVGIGVPLVVRWCGGKRKALKLRDRLRKKGFRFIKMVRMRKENAKKES